MPTFREVLRAAQITIKDNTSGRRMHEIEKILRAHHAFSGLTPEKATAILEDLGPTFVKMGQIASNRSDIIPKAYADAFKQLRANVAPVPFEVIVQTIEESLGHPWRETFADIEEKPLGSASVAQVHRARLAQGLGDPVAAGAQEERPAAGGNGEGAATAQGPVVAVKVRRPNVVEQMAEDITLIRHALALADLTHVTDGIMLTLGDLVDELARTTAEELDFTVELGNLERFGAELASQPHVESPRPYPAFSTDEVLVMEYVEGAHINDLPALRAQGDDPAALGRRLAESYVTQVIDDGFFHADPHPGNILVRGEDIVWIDLGMTGTLSASERAIVGRLFAAVAKNDPFALKDALLALAKAHGPVDHGLLLGQISALAVSGMLADEEAFALVKVRSELMAEAAAAHPGAMSALLKADEENVRALCEECAEGDVLVPANFNCPGQIVVAGTPAAVERAEAAWAEAGKRSSRLATSGAFHSPLMADAAAGLDAYLEDVAFSEARIPLVCNVDAAPLAAADAREHLVRHLTSPVRFQQSVEALAASGADTFVEAGFGGVLANLVKRIDKAATRACVQDRASFDDFLAAQAATDTE